MSDEGKTQAEAEAEYYNQRKAERERKQREARLKSTDSEMIGEPTYDVDETKTCDECGETTPARKWGGTGPTYRDNGVTVQMCVVERCPECGTAQ